MNEHDVPWSKFTVFVGSFKDILLLGAKIKLSRVGELSLAERLQGARVRAVVRALASHQCGPGSIPGPGVICGLSLLLVLVPAPRVFLRVLRFSSLHKNQHFQIPIRSGIRGPQVCQSRDCYVLPSLNKVFITPAQARMARAGVENSA